MITSIEGCVAYNDLWPWPISSRSFGLGLENHVRSVASTVLDGFFSYLMIQMITIMRMCVACDDLWPWPISSRSFHLDFRNGVRSVAFTVLDGFFLYLAQMINIIRGCVAACYVFFRIRKFEFLNFLKKISALTLKKKSTVLDGFFPYLPQMITSIKGCVEDNDLWPWPISSRSFGLEFSVLDRLFPYMPQIMTSIYSSWWILSIFDTNDHYHEKVCHMWWPLTLTYIFKVIPPWLWKSCPLCNVFSSRWIISLHATNNHYY